MSTVPPSPAWATTRTSVRPFTRRAALTPVATAGALPKRECSQGMRHDVSGIGGREDLEAAGGVDGHQLAVARAHGGVEDVAGPERLAAALTGPVAGVEGVGPSGTGLHGAVLFRDQPVAGGVAAHLVEAHRGRGHGASAPPMATGEGRPVHARPIRRAGGRRRLDPGPLALDHPVVEVEEGERLELARARRTRASTPTDRRVTGRPPRPATTVWTGTAESRTARTTSADRTPPPPARNAFSTTTTRPAPARARRTCVGREGTERGDPDHARPAPRPGAVRPRRP